MAKRYAFMCPKCGNKTRVKCSPKFVRYCLCETCNIVYSVQKSNNKVITTIKRLKED